MTPETALVRTRLSLHAVAELLLAGPQYDASGTLRLRVSPGGFATIAEPELAVVGAALLAGSKEILLDGRSIGEVAQDAGVTPRPLGDIQKDHTDLGPGDLLSVDARSAGEIAEALRIGAAALAAYSPATDAVLWPEHFDVGISVDEVNYGVSPGDGYVEVPYAYVGPWDRDGLDGPFWNAPFGAAAPLTELGDETGVAAYFERGRDLLGR
ncbi:hypothetical protein [Nocardioides sp.]|uniref:hypothetical protein n=1 Tax=Nocardioides sp. TaxID=35761 RepID=UPI001A304DCF|nr:hypothetical protein [Nocardioides sp.]MBJ7357215.1 hypothetical protein [Nocardioides sp.]